jgi:pyruvate-formate lyase-activating enzyme
MAVRSSSNSVASLRAVYAREDGAVLDIPEVNAAADGGAVERADLRDFIPLPAGTSLLTLPGRSVVGYIEGKPTVIDQLGDDQALAVAAVLPLGYTRILLPAYLESQSAPRLPLYGYTAVAWSDTGFKVAAVRTDMLESWSAEAHSQEKVRDAISARSQEFPGNVLVAQLARCATEYRCFTAQNVFLRLGEAALPVSPACNARCLGCISEQEPEAKVHSAQERVRSRPSVTEICEVAAAHLSAVPGGIVSFGQGCEGEPLLASDLIEKAIHAIRSLTRNGIVHCNTNASRPTSLERLIKAGLQSIRVSLNSTRPATYAAYYRPRGYDFDDVCESLRIAASHGTKISLNLLTHPGVTDDPAEMSSFARFLHDHPVDMIQTRTLNVDPALYFASVGRPENSPYGMRAWFDWLHREFPAVKIGNFTRGFG